MTAIGTNPVTSPPNQQAVLVHHYTCNARPTATIAERRAF
jgi:hypothetical protein